MPPKITAAKSGIRNSQPMLGKSCAWNTASRIPAMAAMPPPMAQVDQMTRSVGIPVTRAKSGLSAVARMALPIFVRVSSRYTPRARSTAMPAMKMLSGGMRMVHGQVIDLPRFTRKLELLTRPNDLDEASHGDS